MKYCYLETLLSRHKHRSTVFHVIAVAVIMLSLKYVLIIQLLTSFHTEVLSSNVINFGVLQVISGEDRIPICAKYVTPHIRLPDSEDDAITYPLTDLSKLDICDIYNSSLNWKWLMSTPSVVAFTWDNCSVVDAAALVQEFGGKGLLVVAPTIMTQLPSVYEMRNSNDNISIPSALISRNSYRQIQALGGKISVKEYVPQDSFFMDFSFFIMWLVTLITISLGTCWDTCILTPLNRDHTQNYGMGDQHSPNSKNQDVHNPPVQEANKEQVPLSQNAESTKTGNIQDKMQAEDMQLTVAEANRRLGFSILKLVIVIIIMSTFITMLYFFYDYAVYAIMALFALLGISGMFWFLSTFKVLIPFQYSLHCGKFQFEIRQLFILLMCFGFITAWLVTRKESYSWVFQDLLVIFIAMRCISTLHMYNFKVCLVMMLLFFLYTTFLVYGTPPLTPDNKSVMMSLAAGGMADDGTYREHVPMSLRIPSVSPNLLATCIHRDAVIGLIDIVIPGSTVAYSFKFGEKMGKIQCLIYFFGAILATGTGIIFAFIAMYSTNHPQPTLLFITPCLLAAVVIISLCRKEFKRFWEGDEYKVGNES